MMTEKSKSFFTAMLVMLLWGTLFPFVKIGYKVFSIDTKNAYNILLFAGMRFTLCGGIITAFSLASGQRLGGNKTKTLLLIAATGLFATILHYAFTYIGLSLIESSKTSILKQCGALIYICTSFLFIKEEKFNINKLIGGILGFTGIVAINFGSGKIEISLGAVLIICASFCTVISNLFGKKAMSDTPSTLVTGISQLLGGAVLLLAGGWKCSEFPAFTIKSTGVFAYICAASITSYCLWYSVIKKSDLSNLFIIKFSEPLFAMVFGFLLLGEDIFKWQYAVSFLLVSAGIYIANIPKKKAK